MLKTVRINRVQDLLDMLQRQMGRQQRLLKDVAAESGVTSASVCNWLAGVRTPNTDNMIRMCKTLGVSLWAQEEDTE